MYIESALVTMSKFIFQCSFQQKLIRDVCICLFVFASALAWEEEHCPPTSIHCVIHQNNSAPQFESGISAPDLVGYLKPDLCKS